MSFVIDEGKIEDLLRTSETNYKVSIAPGGMAIETHYEPLGYGGIAGTVAVDALGAIRDARKHLLTIRGKIEQSGVHLHGTGELGEEMERMRGR
jgi:hypothetical protein